MTGGVQWVLPSVDPRYRRACMTGMHPHVAEDTLVIDNSIRNRGVAPSWNLGIDRAISEHADWLVMVSESVRFGPAGGLDLEDQLHADTDSPWADTTLGWHLVAFRTGTLQRVGHFDENFRPAYLEDTDYLIRLHLAGYPSPRENDRPHRWITGIDVADLGTEHSIREGLVNVNFAEGIGYYQRKWGCEPPHAAYDHPFNDPTRDWTWWPPPEEEEAA